MKTKILDSFDEAVADVLDGAIIAFSTFGASSQPMNLWEALYKKDVKDLTLIGNMVIPAREKGILLTYAQADCVRQPGNVKKLITGFTTGVYTRAGVEKWK